MQAIVLAAGRGSRLKEMTTAAPKCMVRVDGQSILHRALEALRAVGVCQVTIVTGYLAGHLRAHAAEFDDQLQIDFVHNPDWESTNNITSLWRIGSQIPSETLLIESDLVFSGSLLSKCVDGSAAFVSPIEDWMDGTVVTVSEDGAIDTMFLGPVCRPIQQLFKTVNIYTITPEDWVSTIWPQLDRSVSAGDTSIYYEAAFASAIRARMLKMSAVVVSGDEWREVDTIDDLNAVHQWLAHRTA